jgi:hypothetical protein
MHPVSAKKAVTSPAELRNTSDSILDIEQWTTSEHCIKLFAAFLSPSRQMLESIQWLYSSNLALASYFEVSAITHSTIYTVGLLWTSDQPTQDNTTYKHKRQTSMHPSGIRTRDPSNQAAAYLRLRPRGHWDGPNSGILPVNFFWSSFLPHIFFQFSIH